jgi:hypothetical protein
MGLVAEVTASFKKLAHGEIWQRHGCFLYRLSLRGQ